VSVPLELPVPLPGYGPQQPAMNALVATPFTFWLQRVVFRASQVTTPTTLPSSGAVTKIIYDQVLEDPFSGYNAVTGAWTAPAGCSGWYLILTTCFITSGAGADACLEMYVITPAGDGFVLASVPLNSQAGAAQAWWLTYLEAGDSFFGAAALGNATTNTVTTLVNGRQPAVEAIWLSA
jgi:hypothetical protein